mmetsp:Transcript_1846/g.7719  ORF Transcript_1846/g.7719 Transcript_1846/m.7719 type:complete len:258 (-) Transcript_1846:691-1464(-)
MMRSAPPDILPSSATKSSHSLCIMCGIPALSALLSSFEACAFITIGRLWLAPGRLTIRLASVSPRILVRFRLGSTLNAVGSSGSTRVRPLRMCASMANPMDAAYPTTLRLVPSHLRSPSGTYWSNLVRSLTTRTMFPSSTRASFNRADDELVRNTRTRPSAVPASACAVEGTQTGAAAAARTATAWVNLTPPVTPAMRSTTATPLDASSVASPKACTTGTRYPFQRHQNAAHAAMSNTGSTIRLNTVLLVMAARCRQ